MRYCIGKGSPGVTYLGLRVLLLIIINLWGGASVGCLALSDNDSLSNADTLRKRQERRQEAMVMKNAKNR
jgi:hypothetical protein